MKLIIAGSRGITDYEALKEAIKFTGLWKRHKTDAIEVVSGMAKGVDSLGVEFAKRNSLVLHKFPADWNTHGKAAGHIRNAAMAAFGNVLLALWDGESPGTKNMIMEASKRGLEVFPLVTKMEWTFNGRTAHGCCPEFSELRKAS